MAKKGVELASAYISLSVSTDDVPEQVNKALKAAGRDAATAGKRAGAALSDSLGAELSKGGSQAGGKFTSSFRSQLSGEGRRAASALTGDIESEADRSGARSGRQFAKSFSRTAGDVKVDVDTKSVGNDAGAEAGDAFSGGFAGAIGRLKGGGPIGAAIATAGLAGIKLLGPQIQQAMQDVVAKDLVQARLGLDDATMSRVADASAKAFTSNFGQSVAANMDTATAAIQAGLVKASDDSGAIQKVVERLTTVSTLLGEDVPSVARSAGQAMKTGMAKDATEALDLITKASQNGLNVSGDLLDTLNEYSTQFRKLGISGPEAMALISQAVKNGARDTDVAADAIKEFSIRAVDGSKTTVEAFETLGFNADDMAAKFAAGGQTAHDAFGQILDAIRNIKDPVLQAQVAVQLFGTQAEDLGGALSSFNLDTVVNEFGQVAGASDDAAKTMSSNVANEWTTAKNHLIEYAREIREAWNMSEWFSNIPRAINDFFTDTPPMPPGAPGVPFTPGQNTPPGSGSPGQNPLDVFAGANPTNANTGGALTPATAAVQSYLRNSLGFKGTIGGWGPPDGFNEHSSGKASDVMVGSPAEGNALLPNLLMQPGVEYILWQQKTWYPDGSSKPMEDRGSPTQNHMDHLHVKTFDQGGWWQPGTLGQNLTGQPEYVLTPEQLEELRKQGIDPAAIPHGQTQGAPPGPQGSPPPVGLPQGFGSDILQAGRAEGYTPSGAGYVGKTGGGVAGSFIQMGAEVVKGLIDKAAQAGAMGADMFAPGSGMAIGMAAQAAKRGVDYAAEMGGIGVGAASEIFLPFGAPRWLSDVDPMSFVPQGLMAAATTSGEQAVQQTTAEQQGMKAPPTPGKTIHQVPQTPMSSWPGLAQPPNAIEANVANMGAQRGAQAFSAKAAAPPKPPQPGFDPLNLLSFLPFDTGGILEPGMGAVNLSNRPELVFTQRQWRAMENTASTSNTGPGGNTYHVYATDVDDAVRRLKSKERLNMLQHAGRP